MDTWTSQRPILPACWRGVSSTGDPSTVAVPDHEIDTSFEGFLTAEEIKTVVNQYLKSEQLFNPWDKKSVNVALDGLILDIVSDRDESVRAELLQKKFMSINKVIGKVVNSMDPWYKISSGDGQEITRSALHPQFSTLSLFM